jgi:hypothetical protein
LRIADRQRHRQAHEAQGDQATDQASKNPHLLTVVVAVLWSSRVKAKTGLSSG